MTGASIDVQRPPAGWTHLTGPLLHVLVALDEGDERYGRAVAAAAGGDLDDVLDVLASAGLRRTPAFVAVSGAARPRVVTHSDGYAVLTSGRGTLEVRAPHGRVWTDLLAEEDVQTVALRVDPPLGGRVGGVANPRRDPGDPDRTVDRGALLAVRCPDGHPNPPTAARCRICGLEVPDQAPVETERPTLGVLRLSTGDVVTLDRGVIMGRAPQAPPGLPPDARPHVVRLPSPHRDISRNHVHVDVDGWHVLVRDLDTTNGTTVTLPGGEPVRLRPGDAQILEPGSTVSLAGEITLVYEALE